MSHHVVNLVRKLPMHKTPKFVLWVLADIADDNGYTAHWASSDRIQEETGYSNRAVADSIAYLVNCGVLVVDGGRGKSSKYHVTPEKFNDQVKYDPKAKTKVVSAAHQLKGNEQGESGERGACKVVSGAPEVVSAAQEVVSEAHAIPISLLSPLLSPNIYWKNWLCFSDAKFAGGKYIKSKPEKPKSKPKSNLTPIPENFGISDQVRKWADKNGHAHLEQRLEHFIGYAIANGKTYANWDQAFQNAIRDDWAKLKFKTIATYPQKTASRSDGWDELFEQNTSDIRDVTPPKKYYQIEGANHA